MWWLVVDSLSCDDNRTDSELISILKTFFPNRVQDHFKIVPLPKEIVSWLTSVLQTLPLREQLCLTNAINGSKKLTIFLEDRDYSKINLVDLRST